MHAGGISKLDKADTRRSTEMDHRIFWEKMHFLDFSKKTKQRLHLINCSILRNVCYLDYPRSGLLSPCSHFYRKCWLQERVLKRRSTTAAAVQCKLQAFGAMVEIHAKLPAQVTSLTAFASVTCSSIPE